MKNSSLGCGFGVVFCFVGVVWVLVVLGGFFFSVLFFSPKIWNFPKL